VIHFLKWHKTLGEVPLSRTPIEVRFRLANHGPADLTLKGLHQSCLWTEVLNVPVSWTVAPPVYAVPERLFLGSAPCGEALVRRVLVRTADAQARLHVERVEFGEELVGGIAEWSTVSPQSGVVEVTWTAPARPGVYAGSLSIVAEAPEETVVLVPVSGIALPPSQGTEP
jgi:hypothetical protein